MKSSKNNNNEILDLHSSLKTIAKMSGDEILSKIGEAKIVKKIYDEFTDLNFCITNPQKIKNVLLKLLQNYC